MNETTTSGHPQAADTVRPSSDGTAPSQPTVIGQYSLLEKLGEGGMGCVYKAVHLKLKKTIAIKILSVKRPLLDEFVARFYQEIEAIGRLEHPNLVRATDAGEDQGRHFLVMEYVEGEDLAKILRRRRTLPVAEACGIVRQVAQGLHYLAEKNLVHRDIKPSNLMLTCTGEVKILDLGLALLQREPADDASELTSPGQVMGTWDYMAPEQTRDSHQVDIRADIYSLGCTLYKMLTGVVPFGSSAYPRHGDKVRAHRETCATPVEQLRPDVPDAVAGILERMMAKSPVDRFQSAAELIRAFEAIPCATLLLKRGPSLSAHSDSATSEIDERAPASAAAARGVRSSWLRWAAVATGIVGFILLAVIWSRWNRPDPTDDAATFEPGRWYSLMNRAPKRLLWSNNLPPPVWNEGRKEILAAPAGDLGILGLGVVPPRTDYRFRVNLRQNPWTGNVGVVFGFRETHEADTRIVAYESIGLDPRPDGSFVMERRRTKFTFPADGPSHKQSTIVAAQLVDVPPRDEDTLEIEVHRDHLFRVQWAGAELHSLCNKKLENDLAADSFAGAVGIFCSNNMAIFRNGEVMHLDR